MVEKIVKEPVDENNAAVMDLVAAGFTVEQSIDAVNKCGNLEAALTYLEGCEVDDYETGIIPLKFSREDSQDGFSIDW